MPIKSPIMEDPHSHQDVARAEAPAKNTNSELVKSATEQNTIEVSNGIIVWCGENGLPQEVRCMVLEAIIEEHSGHLAQFASVSKEWKSFIEAETFRSIKLRTGDIKDFAKLDKKKRYLVKHIWLHIELPKYSCGECNGVEGDRDYATAYDGSVIKRAVDSLLKALSKWPPNGHVALELSLQSVSDDQHWFKHLDFPGSIINRLTSTEESKNAFKGHGWVEGVQVTAPPKKAIQDLFAWAYDGVSKYGVQARVITDFTIRRHSRRLLSIFDIEDILDRLPQLDCLNLEGWVLYDAAGNAKTASHCLPITVKENLPFTLRKITYFQDFNEDFNAICGIESDAMESTALVTQGWFSQRNGDDGISVHGAFARRSLELEELCVSYIINATKFFKFCGPAWQWGSLQTLALTSADMMKGNESAAFQLIINAGETALRMQALRIMVLWFAKRGEATAFEYSKEKLRIRWCSTQSFIMWPRIVTTWEEVASREHPVKLAVEHKTLDSEKILSHGDGIHYLELPKGVVDPLSLQQIRKDAKKADWGGD